jgi:hypothetical protein
MHDFTEVMVFHGWRIETASSAATGMPPLNAALVCRYLDGEAGVRVCVAMDMIATGVLRKRKAGTTALAYLLSPATAYPTDAESYEKRAEGYEKRGWSASLMWLSPNHRPPVECEVPGGGRIRMPVVDGFITAQGPNYALSKTLQQWRAMVERSRGVRVSANFAPPCRTDSVMHSKTVACAIEGASYGPSYPLLVYLADVAPLCRGAPTIQLTRPLVRTDSSCPTWRLAPRRHPLCSHG